MAKVFVLSSLLMSVWLPIRAARRRHAQGALARTIRYVAAYNLLWLVGVLYVLPRLAA